MPRPIACSLLICEKILREDDGVLSVIRLYDLYKLSPFDPGIPPEQRPISITVLAQVRYLEHDEEDHQIELVLISPGAEPSVLYAIPEKVRADKKLGFPSGIDLNISGNVPSIPGTHFLALNDNGSECCRAVFTVLAPPQN